MCVFPALGPQLVKNGVKPEGKKRVRSRKEMSRRGGGKGAQSGHRASSGAVLSFSPLLGNGAVVKSMAFKFMGKEKHVDTTEMPSATLRTREILKDKQPNFFNK